MTKELIEKIAKEVGGNYDDVMGKIYIKGGSWYIMLSEWPYSFEIDTPLFPLQGSVEAHSNFRNKIKEKVFSTCKDNGVSPVYRR